MYYNHEVIYMTENKYGLTNRIRISNAVDKELYAQLKQISEEKMIPVSKLLDRAIELLVEEYK
ncbi:ribbon-helix-helix domain-containing protein [Staphylococcus aureus]|uniref:ribbon-helix-helix domain-containing protein n=2 Tax=Staphylococcus aureus TaxID=1280 RepID=UPI001F10C144|nr:ribbon-helix-helix domain-containing protein [Staphylococcus aureus]